MSFTVIIPARLASTRLPNKPLADLGGKPMVVRVAERARASGAARIVVATDHADILAACAAHGIEARMTRSDHPSGTDRIAEVARALGLAGRRGRGQPAGRRAADRPGPAVRLRRPHQGRRADGDLRPSAERRGGRVQPERGQGRARQGGQGAVFLARHHPLAPRRLCRHARRAAAGYAPLRHIGLYAYSNAFLQAYPGLEPAPLEQVEALEQLRVLWHGYPIAVHITDSAPPAGVDTPEDLARVRLHYAS
jgi:3-deoxy-manno-octulosonate cytidylyltransferase (CMP-KDO synthetase)